METLEESIIKFKLKLKDKRRRNGNKAHKINDAIKKQYRQFDFEKRPKGLKHLFRFGESLTKR